MSLEVGAWIFSTIRRAARAEIFLLRYVFNIKVENLVETELVPIDNSANFNAMMRFALFLCNAMRGALHSEKNLS
jgi:hypothetical protein